MKKFLENKKLKRFTTFIAITWIFLSVYQLLMYFKIAEETLFFKILFSISLTIFAPIYFIFIARYYRKNNKIKKTVLNSIKLILIFVLIDFVLSGISIPFVELFSTTKENSNFDTFTFNSIKEVVIIFISLLWSLAGEEGGKIAFYLYFNEIIVLDSFNNKFKYWAIWLIGSIVFGLLHLTAYDYNLYQCIFVIGLPSIIYGFLWKKTENPKVLWLTHLIYDYIVLGVVILGNFI